MLLNKRINNALSIFEKALNIFSVENHPDLIIIYHNIGTVYEDTIEYSQALAAYEKEIEIQQIFQLGNDSNLVQNYHNIALLNGKLRQYEKSILFYGKELQIINEHLSSDELNLFPSYEKASEIQEKFLSPNHPHLIICQQQIDIICKKME
jgi:tetratricopeptide (TPR) repeat protein